MKRLFIILAAALILSGCGQNDTPTEPTEATMPQIEGVEYRYVTDSTVEQQTGGAVRVYRLEPDTYFGLRRIGANLVAMGNKGLTVLSGEWGEVIATQESSDIRVAPVVDTAATGMAYYLPNSRLVMILNPQLQTVTQHELPKEIVGNPYISLTRNEIYYSTGNELRAMNIDTGISRLLRQQSAVTQTLLDIYFDGAVLFCRFADEAGKETQEYISAETGQTLSQDAGVLRLHTDGGRFIADWQDGAVLQTVFGTKDGQLQSFLPKLPSEDQNGGRAELPEMNSIVDYVHTQDGLELSYYDLNSGKLTAKILLPAVQSPAAFCVYDSAVWVLATDNTQTCQMLYRWDITKSAVEDETVCVGPLYTTENPDKDGLKACQKIADTFQTQYGVKVLIWKNAVACTGGYTVKAEHHPQVFQEKMEQMKPLLELFPKNFLLKTVEAGWIKIALVQSIEGGADWVQFWEEGDCWILLSVKAEVIPSLIQGIAYGIDSHVLGNSRDFDTWAELNPAGFTYAYGKEVNENSKYLKGGSRAFADAQSMGYPHEDRSRIFYHAMLADNAEMFQSSVMQAKLLRVCEGIREAYNLEKKTDVYAWEQYLKKPIAYTPKT